jgi:hypothetical protein
LQQVMIHLTGTRFLGDGAIWWILPYFFLFGAIGSRLLVDMRHCRLSSAALLVAAACFGLAVAIRMGWVLGAGDPRTVMFKAAAEMSGGVFLLLAMALHGRYVILDAEGLLPRRQPKRGLQSGAPDEEKDQQQAAAGDPWTKIDSPHATPQPIWTRSASAGPPTALPGVPSAAAPVAPAAAVPRAGAQASQSPVTRKLTKAERKALRQRLEQERLKRQQQQRSGWGK